MVGAEDAAVFAEPSFGSWLEGALATATAGLTLEVLNVFVLVVVVVPVDFATIETV